jgi:hypothetical protein
MCNILSVIYNRPTDAAVAYLKAMMQHSKLSFNVVVTYLLTASLLGTIFTIRNL